MATQDIKAIKVINHNSCCCTRRNTAQKTYIKTKLFN